MKRILPFLLLISITELSAQTAITSYTIVNDAPASSSNTSLGWNTSGAYNNTTSYTNFYGQRNGGAAGIERRVTGFSIGALTYSALPRPGGLPYDNVIINRHPSLPGDTINTLYEYTANAGNNLFYEASYLPTLSAVINSLVCNRGSDNTFSNRPTTQANIERIDEIINTGINCTVPARQGFLVNERAGNDNFKVAAITSLTSGTVNTLGSLVNVLVAAWGKVGPAIVSKVLSKTSLDLNLRVKQDIGSQIISGVFISFADLGISIGTKVYGLSIFPNDVTAAMNLVTLVNVPTDTDAGASGGLDMMAGGGFFVENTVLPLNLTSFNGRAVDNNINLYWKTENQFNFSRFELERSLNSGNDFEKISTINAVSNPQGNYNFSDINIAQRNSKTYLYRLKMINMDGSFSYSNTVAFKFSKTISFSVFPNVITQSQTFNIQIADNGNFDKYNISIIDNTGRIVKNMRELQNGQYPVNSTDFGLGIYFIKIESGEVKKIFKLIVQ